MEQLTLDKNIKNSTKWSLIGQIVSKIASPLINMVLARILMPEEFGIVATITIIISFSFIFVDGGFSNYIIQHKFDDDGDYKSCLNTAFWSNLIMSAVFALLIVILSNPLCYFLGTPGYEGALMLASIQIPLNALSSIFMAHMNKQFKFKRSSLITVVTSFLPFVITIPLALLGFSYFSLIIGTIASYLSRFILYLFLSGWRPSFSFSTKSFKKMFMFCFILTVRQFFIYTASYISTFIISQSFSQHFLGLYKNTNSTITSIYSIFTAATMPVLLSGLSKAENDEILYDIYLKNQRYLSYMIIPMCLGIIIFQKEVTLIMFGDGWLDAAPFIGAFAFTNGISALTNNFLSTMFIAKGRIYVSIFYQFLETASGGILYYCFSLLGEENYFYVLYVVGTLNVLYYIIFFKFVFKAKLKLLLKNYLKPIMLTAIMALFTIPLSFVYYTMNSFIVIVILSMVIYFIFFYLMFKKDLLGFIQTYIYSVKSKI